MFTRVLDFWTGIADANGNIVGTYNSGDGVHLNNKGHRVLYERVVAAKVFVYTNVETSEEALPETYQLYHNFPNPFNATTVLRYDLPKEGHVQLEVFDIAGRRTAVLVDQKQKAGKYQADWNAASMASGVYVVRLTVNGWRQHVKMTLIK
jgi:hypothetical protein